MRNAIRVKTHGGEWKVITGHPRALRLRREIRRTFDELRAKYPTETFSELCRMTAEHYEITWQRVRDVMRKDFEY